MRNWPAIILAPTVAFANLAITYAMAIPSCERQNRIALHSVAAVTLLLALFCTLIAWRNWRAAGAPAPGDAADKRAAFLALVGVMVGALSSLVIAAQWLPQWILSPCAA